MDHSSVILRLEHNILKYKEKKATGIIKHSLSHHQELIVKNQ